MPTVLVVTASIGSVFERAIVDTGRLPDFLFFVAFLVSWGFIRTSAHMIRAQVRWWPGNVQVGGTHIHHLVWGILILLVFGYVGVVFQPDSPWHEIIAVLFGIGTKVVAISSRLCPPDHRVERFFRLATLERGLVLGAGAVTIGLGLIAAVFNLWRMEHFGSLAEGVTLRWVIPGATLTAAGLQTILSSFFISIIGRLHADTAVTDRVGSP